MPPNQISCTRRSRGRDMILYNDLYNCGLSTIFKIFWRHFDPHISVMLHVESGSCDNHFLLIQVFPFGMKLFISVGAEIVPRYIIKEIFIDSTFETTQNNFQLLCVLVPCFPCKFAISYIVLKSGTQKPYRRREKSVAGFELFKKYFPSLSPCFFLEKVVNQLKPIKNMWYAYLTLPLPFEKTDESRNKRHCEGPDFLRWKGKTSTIHDGHTLLKK